MSAERTRESTRGPGSPSRVALEWLTLGFTLIALAGWVAFELRSSRQAIESQHRSRLEQQARIVEKMLGTRLQATGNALDALRADLPALLSQEHGAERLNEHMQVMVSSMAGVRTFLLVNAAGIAIASNRRELIGGDWHEGERYRAIKSHPSASMLYLSPPFMTPLGNWALSLGRAVLDRQGGFDGYVLAIIDPEYFQLLLDSTRYAPDMSTAMIHGAGKIIYRVPDFKGAVGMDLAEKPEALFLKHLQRGSETTSWTGALMTTGQEALTVLQTIRPSKSASDGFLVASFSRETGAMLAGWRNQLRDRVIVMAVVAVAAISGLYLHQRRRAASARIQAEREVERRKQDEARSSLQAQLAQAQKLESVGRLAGGIAHDFNNLLTVILSYGDEARQEVKRGKAPDPESIDEILAAARRAADLTRQLLAFARKQIIAPVTLDVNEHIRNSQKLLGRVIGEDVRIVERLQADPWPVRCDPGLLGQVILNLAVNARDAMPGGGTFTVTTQNLTVSPGASVPDPAMAPGDYVRLAVEDTGTGMPPEVLQHVFEPFFTTKGPGRGTGLGLATVYGIVMQSGAHMGVRSVPGQGTTFEILFPRQAAEHAAPVQDLARVEGGSETILVVEDDPSVRGAMVQALRSGGYHVLTATGLDEAVALAGSEPGRVHLLLTDVVMPGHGGPEVARRVVERSPGMRVLYVSGYTQDAISRHGVLAEGIDLVPKPFTADALRARVREVLDRAPRPAAS
jgi:signal transduction histidine kinase/ActR/RegA family two-component response regulator